MYKNTQLVRELIAQARATLNQSEEKTNDEEVLERLEAFVLYDKRTKGKSYQEQKELISHIFNALRKDLDILQPLAEDSGVNEIMVNGINDVFIERQGHIEKTDIVFDDVEHLEEIIRRVAAKVHREINELHPIVDARLEDGSRVNAVYKNVAVNGPILTIRKFPKMRITMEDLIRAEAITQEAAAFLKRLVESGYNIFISGGTSSGKTTFLNVLSGFIPKDERVIVIEDSAELQLHDIGNIVRMEARSANVQGKGEVSMRSLINTALRMRPDRIVVGEVRGAEVLDMIQAMNTGHDGSLSTGHANSPTGMISRMETMFLMAMSLPVEAVRGQICSAIDILVHLGRMQDKSRKVLEIAELQGFQDGEARMNTLYKITVQEDGSSRLMPTGNGLVNVQKLKMREAFA